MVKTDPKRRPSIVSENELPVISSSSTTTTTTTVNSNTSSKKRKGRTKIAIAYVRDPGRRKSIMNKRTSGFVKKAKELSTLGGIMQFVLLYNPETDSGRQLWSKNASPLAFLYYTFKISLEFIASQEIIVINKPRRMVNMS